MKGHPWFWCDRCSKRGYLSRGEAKRVVRIMPVTGTRKPRPYRCPHDPTLWHIGHLPEDVIQGSVSREEMRGNMIRRDSRNE